MDLGLNWFDVVVILMAHFWYFSLPIAILLFWFAIAHKDKRGWGLFKRGVAVLFGLLFLLGPAMALGFYLDMRQHGIQYEKDLKKRTRVLKQPQMVAGIALPKNSTVILASTDAVISKHTKLADLEEIKFPGTIAFMGMQLDSVVDFNTPCESYLAHPQKINGFWFSGEIEFYLENLYPDRNVKDTLPYVQIKKGLLARDTLFHKKYLPKGTQIEFRSYGNWIFFLPKGKYYYYDVKKKIFEDSL